MTRAELEDRRAVVPTIKRIRKEDHQRYETNGGKPADLAALISSAVADIKGIVRNLEAGIR